MKIRNGFVSNSSSSSFVILGVKLTAAEKKELWDDDKYDYKVVKGLMVKDDEDTGAAIIGVGKTMYEQYGVFNLKADPKKVEELLRTQFGPDRELDISVWFGMECS